MVPLILFVLRLHITSCMLIKTSKDKPTNAGHILDDSLATSLAEKKVSIDTPKNILVVLYNMCETGYLHCSICRSQTAAESSALICQM